LVFFVFCLFTVAFVCLISIKALGAGHNEAAIYILEEAIESNPQEVEAYILLSKCYRTTDVEQACKLVFLLELRDVFLGSVVVSFVSSSFLRYATIASELDPFSMDGWFAVLNCHWVANNDEIVDETLQRIRLLLNSRIVRDKESEKKLLLAEKFARSVKTQTGKNFSEQNCS
jgi:hypothetical protein